MKSRRMMFWLLVLLVLALGAFLLHRSHPAADSADTSAEQQPAQNVALTSNPPTTAPVAPGDRQNVQARTGSFRPAGAGATQPPSGASRSRQVIGDPKHQQASVHEALNTGQHPERLSPMLAPAPFDKAKFEKDPQTYLDVIEPGRVFQCAQPGPDVPALTLIGPVCVSISARDSAPVEVRGAPCAPVTFTALDLGKFLENDLNTITVQADGDGLARVTFAATKGAINDCRILIGSPLASGKVTCTVNVKSPPVIVSPTQPKPAPPPGE